MPQSFTDIVDKDKMDKNSKSKGQRQIDQINGNVIKRRNRIPDKPEVHLNLWSILKSFIGKDLTKIPLPVNFNEPLSMLQRSFERTPNMQ